MTSVLALAGGVGGAKLALGLARVLPSKELTVVVNTGDDEEFYGLHVSPDLDTVMYTMAGVANPETGWGLADDTFNALKIIGQYGVSTWFNLGDKDLATHLVRTEMMRTGHTLSEVTDILCAALGVKHKVAPMSDQRIRTIVETEEGDLSFQTYFVKRHCEPKVKGFRYEMARDAMPSPKFTLALESKDLSGIIVCPSNPFLSIAPILTLPGIKAILQATERPRVIVSPIVGGEALRGPAAKIMTELGHETSSLEIARQYQGLCDVFVIDPADQQYAENIADLGMRPEIFPTVMNNEEDKVRLAKHIIGLLTRAECS